MPETSLTLIRLFQNNDRIANIVVDDWASIDSYARFTIPSDHPRARWLMDAAFHATASAIVMSSDEIEWMINSVTSGSRYEVKMISRTHRIRLSQPADDFGERVLGIESRLFAITNVGARVPVDFKYSHTGKSGRRYWTIDIDDEIAEIMPHVIAFDGIPLSNNESLVFPEPGVGWNTREWGTRIMENSRHVFVAYDNRPAT